MNYLYRIFNVPVDYECMPYPDSYWYDFTIWICDSLEMLGITYNWMC